MLLAVLVQLNITFLGDESGGQYGLWEPVSPHVSRVHPRLGADL